MKTQEPKWKFPGLHEHEGVSDEYHINWPHRHRPGGSSQTVKWLLPEARSCFLARILQSCCPAFWTRCAGPCHSDRNRPAQGRSAVSHPHAPTSPCSLPSASPSWPPPARVGEGFCFLQETDPGLTSFYEFYRWSDILSAFGPPPRLATAPTSSRDAHWAVHTGRTTVRLRLTLPVLPTHPGMGSGPPEHGQATMRRERVHHQGAGWRSLRLSAESQTERWCTPKSSKNSKAPWPPALRGFRGLLCPNFTGAFTVPGSRVEAHTNRPQEQPGVLGFYWALLWARWPQRSARNGMRRPGGPSLPVSVGPRMRWAV